MHFPVTAGEARKKENMLSYLEAQKSINGQEDMHVSEVIRTMGSLFDLRLRRSCEQTRGDDEGDQEKPEKIPYVRPEGEGRDWVS